MKKHLRFIGVYNIVFSNIGRLKRQKGEKPMEREKHYLNVRIDDIIFRHFKMKCFEEGLTMTKAVEEIIRVWLDDRPKKSNQEPAGALQEGTARDDGMWPRE